jgi:hypothetical protein
MEILLKPRIDSGMKPLSETVTGTSLEPSDMKADKRTSGTGNIIGTEKSD